MAISLNWIACTSWTTKCAFSTATREPALLVRVLITSSDGARNWTTVGASTNIIEASWTAISDAVEFFLLTYDQQEFTGTTARAEDFGNVQPLADGAQPIGTPVHAGNNRSAELTSAG